jgi:hypothetical protein
MITMDLQELKELWSEYDRKLDKNLQLNLQLLRKINFDKVAGKARTLFLYKLVEMVLLMFMLVYLIDFEIKNITDLSLTIPGAITLIFIIAAFITDIRMMAIIGKLRSDYDAPVSPMQKEVEKLKLLIIGYVKWSFLSIPFYPALLIVAGKVFLHINFWDINHHNYLYANIFIGTLLVPLFSWMYVQLSKPVIKNNLVKNFLSGSGWNQAHSAQEFLEEIERFEKD